MTGNLTVKQYFRSLQIIHFGLIAGQILFALVVRFVSKNNGLISIDPTFTKILEIVSVILLFMGFFGGTFLFNSRMNVLKQQESLSQKMMGYKSILILRYALLEAPSFFALIAYLLTNNELFLVLVTMVIFIFILLRPSPDMAIKNLNLEYADAEFLNDPKSIIE